jgi:hypothetical protein
MRRSSTVIMALLCASTLKVKAQNGFSQLIKSGPGDATKLVNAYAEPLFKGFGVGINSGWNNTAETKNTLKFDLRVTATGAFVPSADKTFDVTTLGLSNNIRPRAGSSTITPTIGGGGDNRTTFDIFNDNNEKVDNFTMPEGKTSVIPAPQIQLTVGVLKNTDVTLRAIPKINMGNDVGRVSMIGFGVKHDIIKDFAGTAGKIIPFNLAIAVGYTQLSLDIPLDVKPAAGAIPTPGNQSSNFDNQHIEGHFNGWNFQAIISKKVSFFTPFLSVGYNTANTNVKVLGNYPITTDAIAGQRFYENFSNPITIREKSINGIRADVGFQLELGAFRFYSSYSAAAYQSVNAGIGGAF